MGNPVHHSLSPRIHSLFAGQTGQELYYQAILVKPGQFQTAMQQFRDSGGKGLNVTVPYKPDACAAAEELTERARLAGAVNTMWFADNGRVHGDNTDGVGLLTDLTVNHGIALQDSRILLLGAGGAVQGIIGPLLDAQPRNIVIANRTVSKAEKLVHDFDQPAVLSACAFDELEGGRFNLVINATSASLNADVPPVPGNVFAADAVSYDLMYSTSVTAFQEWSREQGVAVCLDGLGMLVEQAAEAFAIWRGVRPETAQVINTLRSLH